jgi:hypothetical protein
VLCENTIVMCDNAILWQPVSTCHIHLEMSTSLCHCRDMQF